MEASLRFSCGHGLPSRLVAATADLVGWNSRRPRCAAAFVPFFIASGDTRGARGALAGVWAAPVGTVFEEENHPIFVEAREVTRRGRGTNR
jgi:hypothetical protein